MSDLNESQVENSRITRMNVSFMRTGNFLILITVVFLVPRAMPVNAIDTQYTYCKMNDGHMSGCLPLPHSSWCLLFFLQVHWNSQMWRETVPFPGLAVGLSALSCSVRSWVSRKMPREAQGLPREDVPIARPSHWLHWKSWPSPGLLSVFICEISHLGDTASRFPFSFYIP